MAVLLSTATCIACDKQEESPILNQYGDAADPAELSAGSSTIFATGVTAYDTPGRLGARKPEHTVLPRRRLVRQPAGQRRRPESGREEVRSMPVLRAEAATRMQGAVSRHSIRKAGTGTGGFSSHLIYITKKNGSFFRNYGRVLHRPSHYRRRARREIELSPTPKSS